MYPPSPALRALRRVGGDAAGIDQHHLRVSCPEASTKILAGTAAPDTAQTVV